MFPKGQVSLIQSQGFFTGSCQSRPNENQINSLDNDKTPTIKNLFRDIDSVDNHDVGRFQFLGNRFSKYASVVHHFLAAPKANATILTDLSRKARLRIQNLSEFPYQPTPDQIARFQSLNIPSEKWDLAMLEYFDKIDDEELQLMANWRRDFVDGDIEVLKNRCKVLIGAYLDGRDLRQTLLFMSWLGIPVLPTNIQLIKQGDDESSCRYTASFGEWQKPPSFLESADENKKRTISDMLIGYSALEGKLGYKFNDRPLMLQAVAHSSFTGSNSSPIRNNGQLSVLGDAVLDYVIAKNCYEDQGNLDGDDCLERALFLATNMTLGNAVVRAGIHKFLRHKNKKVMNAVYGFEKRQKQRKFKTEADVSDLNLF